MDQLLSKTTERLKQVTAALRRAEVRHIATPTTSSARDMHMLMGQLMQLQWVVEEIRGMVFEQGDLNL